MCFIAKRQPYKVAKEDIPVWKILEKDYKSAYQGFQYREGVLYTQRMYEVKKTKQYVGGFDCVSSEYLSNISNGHDWGFERLPELIYIDRGFHSITDKMRGQKVIRRYGIKNSILVEFIIPKGSKYYEDGTHLCVSNRIIMKKH
jgi:hypothetical protein